MRPKVQSRSIAAVVVIGIVVVAVIFLGVLALSYNGLVAGQQSVLAQWAQVENQYQRKIDLIPRLVNTTSQYAEFEAALLQNITTLRSQWQTAQTLPERVNASNLLDLSLLQLVLTYENYPTAQFPQLVHELMFELTSAENSIAVERLRFNDRVRAYNTRVMSFPDAITASLFGLRPYDYYDPIPGGP